MTGEDRRNILIIDNDSLLKRQFLRNYNVYKMCGFAVMTAKRVRGSVSEAALLPTEEGCVRAYPV